MSDGPTGFKAVVFGGGGEDLDGLFEMLFIFLDVCSRQLQVNNL